MSERVAGTRVLSRGGIITSVCLLRPVMRLCCSLAKRPGREEKTRFAGRRRREDRAWNCRSPTFHSTISTGFADHGYSASLRSRKKSTHDRSLIIISCHALLLSLRRLPPLSLASCFSHANSYLSVRIADPTDRSEPTSGFLLVFEPLELEPGCGRPRKIHRSLHLAVVFVPCVHRQNYSPLRDDVAVFLLPALRRGSIYGVVEGRSSKEGGSLHVQRSRCGYRISDRRCEFETRADTMRLKKADPKSRDVARTRLLRP